MATLQQQKDAIDESARLKKVEADEIAEKERQYAADEESRKVKEQADYDISQIQKDAQI
jgi:hypothetical protein